MARFVNEIGTGLKGSGMERGPRTQVTAVMTPIRAIRFVVKNDFLSAAAETVLFIV